MNKYIVLILLLCSGIINAGETGSHGIDGKILPLYSIIPFVGILLSIAIIPLIRPNFWHHNFGKISMFWATLFIIPFSISFGTQLTIYEFLHVMLLEYCPFIILLLALYTVGGGIQLKGSIIGTPKVNLLFLLRQNHA